jgi:ATP-dependent Clp protease ATP-binding subunit ClpA
MIRQGIESGFEAVLSLLRTASGEGSPPRSAEEAASERTEEPADAPTLLNPEIAPSEDLTFRARQIPLGTPSPFEGDAQFEAFAEAIVRRLHRPQLHHALIVGERGVGQHLLMAELARRGITGQYPLLAGKRILAVNARHTDPDESRDRLMAILAAVAPREDMIICLEGIAALLRTRRGGTNAPALLSALASVRCRLIGIMDPLEYRELVAEDVELREQFAALEVLEPDIPTSLKVVRYFAAALARQHNLAIDDDAVLLAVTLSANYILHDRLPAKALKILQRVCQDAEFERSQLGRSRGRVTADEVVHVVAEVSGVPAETLRGIAERCDYEESLGQDIVGQSHAVREVAAELGLIKAGLTDANKPASVLLFIGQTGTGKTEMAKSLARFYSATKRLRTYTLGNFAEPHSVSGLIGVPAGYVGHDQGGRLVNDLNADPYCVFLLDEADKAHPDVLQPLLNLFDEGWIRDQRGVQAYANKAIFILTTNVGQRMIADMAKQGKSIDEITTRMKEALSQIKHGKSNRPVFAPEFLARIKRIVVFRPLDRDAMAGICQRIAAEAKRVWLEKRQRTLQLPEPLLAQIADRAHQLNEKSDGREGGRIVRKLFADLVETPIQRAIAMQPAVYRACHTVALESAPSSDGEIAAAPEFQVVLR